MSLFCFSNLFVMFYFMVKQDFASIRCGIIMMPLGLDPFFRDDGLTYLGVLYLTFLLKFPDGIFC